MKMKERIYTKPYNELTKKQKKIFDNAQELLNRFTDVQGLPGIIPDEIIEILQKYSNCADWYKYLDDKDIKLFADFNKNLKFYEKSKQAHDEVTQLLKHIKEGN